MPSSQRVRHALTLRRNACATYFAPASVSAAGNAHCAGTPASASVRVSSVSAGTVASGVEDDPVVGRRELVLVDERCEQRIGAEAAQEAGRADHLRGCRSRDGSTRKRPSAAACASGSSNWRPAGTTARAACAGARPARSAPRRWNGARPRAEKYSPRHVERPPQRLAPPDRDDLRARPRARSATPSPPRAPRRRRVTLDAYVMRLVRVDDARIAAQLVRDVQARDVRARAAHA